MHPDFFVCIQSSPGMEPAWRLSISYTESMNYDAVVLAAGKGSRSGLSFNKVLYPYQDRPLLAQSLDLFLQDPDCASVIVTCSSQEMEQFSQLFPFEKVRLVCGGKERQDSVRNALDAVESRYVLIHDGARPFCSRELLERIKAALAVHPAVIPAIPVTDTIKQVDENGMVVSTPPRAALRAVQTPQAFETKLIIDALDEVREKNLAVTDDAQALEQTQGVAVYCVEGELSNVKITSPRDIEQIEFMQAAA